MPGNILDPYRSNQYQFRQLISARLLIRLLNRNDRSISGTAPELLLTIDADRAMEILLSSEYFTIENKQVQYIIRALNGSGHRIPHETLLPFLKAMKPYIGNYPYDYEYAQALLAYANNPDEFAEQTLRTELKTENERVQEAAAEVLAILSGVSNASETVFDAVSKQGFEECLPPQQHYYAVLVYDGEVNNGGHAQYFVNSSGDRWKSAIEGLKAIGATERAKILLEAVTLFGPSGPSVENDPRSRQLARFSRQQDKALDELDRRYYACNENVEVSLAQYALEHKEHFTAQK